jgi:hypothetical protein
MDLRFHRPLFVSVRIVWCSELGRLCVTIRIRASTAGMQNKDVPRSTATTHGHQRYRKFARRPRSPSVLNQTQTPTTRTASTVYVHETQQHLPTPMLEQPVLKPKTCRKEEA